MWGRAVPCRDACGAFQLCFPSQGPASEGLAELRGCLGKVQALARKVGVPAQATEADSDTQLRLSRARLLGAKICARRAAKKAQRKSLSPLQAGKKDPEPVADARCAS